MVEVLDRTGVAFDLDALADGLGVTAVFVRQMAERIRARPDDRVEGEALQLGLRALHGERL